jgi:hypothetical protein
VSAAVAGPARAATITVDTFGQVDPGKCTIAVAIASVNAAADQPGCMHAGTYGTNDTIVLAAGNYASTVADNGSNAYPVIVVPVTFEGHGARLVRAVGNVPPFFRFFEIAAGGLTITDVTLTGGDVPGGDGGAILSSGGPLDVARVTFSGNAATGGDGGAVHHSSTEAANISDSTFTNNTVSPNGQGGAILDSSIGGLTVTNCTFMGNSALGGRGGAILDASTGGLAFHGGSVTGNSVGPGGDGGGIYDVSTLGLRVTNVLFSGNTAGGIGGAIYDNSSGTAGPVSDNCFVGNTATGGGGGIFRVSPPALNAVGNWWGVATGPAGDGPGSGDAVGPNVTFAPFLTGPAPVCAPPTTTTSTTTTTTLPETCGDCADNDGNGLTDFEDPACCPAGSTLALQIRRALLLPRKKGGTQLGLDTIIREGAAAGLDPLTQDVFLQIREQGGAELLCARLPATRFVKRRGKIFRFADRKRTEEAARGVTGARLRRAKRDVHLHAAGPRADGAIPAGTTLAVTVGFQNPGGHGVDDRCAGTVRTFRRSGKRGGVRIR